MHFPINNGIKNYISKKRISFSMPGHKGNGAADTKSLFKLDVTELDDTDNLMAPTSYIKDSQKKISKLYKSVSSHYLIGGSTCGIYAMISLAVSEGDKIIVDRFCHKSVISAIILRGAVPVYITPEYNYQLGFSGGISPLTVEEAVISNPDARAVIITTPTYYGIVSDVGKISEIVHRAGMLLLVDEAHGAHFHISDKLPESSVNCGADMAVQSVHKTLGALSGSALLHINTENYAPWQIEEVLSMYQTSSPSYGMLCITEAAVMQSFGFSGKYEKMILRIEKCREAVNSIGRAYWAGAELIGARGIYDIDKTRIVINFSKLAVTGYDVAQLLREKYKLEVEMADICNVVCIATPYNKLSDINKLAKAVIEISSKMMSASDRAEAEAAPAPKVIMKPRQAHLADWEAVDIENSAGRISRRSICKYPPGIPLIVPGEEIQPEHIKVIADTIRMGGTVSGMDSENKIAVIK